MRHWTKGLSADAASFHQGRALALAKEGFQTREKKSVVMAAPALCENPKEPLGHGSQLPVPRGSLHTSRELQSGSID